MQTRTGVMVLQGRTRPTLRPARWGPAPPQRLPSSTRPLLGSPEARQTKHPPRMPLGLLPPSAHVSLKPGSRTFRRRRFAVAVLPSPVRNRAVYAVGPFYRRQFVVGFMFIIYVYNMYT